MRALTHTHKEGKLQLPSDEARRQDGLLTFPTNLTPDEPRPHRLPASPPPLGWGSASSTRQLSERIKRQGRPGSTVAPSPHTGRARYRSRAVSARGNHSSSRAEGEGEPRT